MKTNIDDVKSIEAWIDIQTSKASGEDQTRHRNHRNRMRRTKVLGKLSPIGIALVLIGSVALGVLGGYFFTTLNLNMYGTITTNGETVQSIFTWDGTMLTEENTSIPMDINSLDAGEYIVVDHILRNVDNGDWLITFTFGPEMDGIFTDPSNAFYGFSLEITPEFFVLSPGESQVISFNYSLHHEFLDPVVFGYNDTNDMPFNLTIHIDQVSYPSATDDTYAPAPTVTHVEIDALVNDIDPCGEGLNIIDVAWIGDSAGMTVNVLEGTPDLVQVFGPGGGLIVAGSYDIEYTIQDGNGLQDTAIVHLNIG